MPAAEEAIVLVGGLGTRLRAELVDLPKPLAPVAGRPFLAFLLDQLAAGGLRRTILASGHLADKVESAIGHRWHGMEIVYSVEDEPLGTGGAVALAAHQLLGGCAHIANGDTFLHFELRSLQRAVEETDAALGMALARVPEVGRYGAVEVLGGRVSAFREKGGHGPGTVNAGSYFLTPEAIAAFPQRKVFSFEEDVLLPMANAGRVAVLVDTSDFIDIGVPEDYRNAQRLFAGLA